MIATGNQSFTHNPARTEAPCRSSETARIGAHRLEAYGTSAAHLVIARSGLTSQESDFWTTSNFRLARDPGAIGIWPLVNTDMPNS